MSPTEEKNHDFKGSSALDAFLNLLSLITLGWMSIALGITLFQIIDKFFSSSQISNLSYFSQSGLKFGLASLIIITPIFLAIISILHRNYKRGVLNPQGAIYRWLTYLVLLVAALNIIGRLIQLVFQLLDGDYTLALILKILVVLIIAGCIFGFYAFDLRRTDYQNQSIVSQLFFGAIILVVLTSIIGGFFIIDSPVVTRMKKQDQKRVTDLYNLDSLLTSEYNNSDVLPNDLSAQKFQDIKDPISGQPYEYKKINDDHYELCAVFEPETEDNNDPYRSFSGGRDWEFHNVGRECYQINVKNYDNQVPKPVIID